MLSEIKERYSQSINISDSFLQSKKSVVKGTSITSTRELCLLRNDAECPICGIRFVGKNNNTEHILPRALGGLNKNENKIQICTACNHVRNLTMQSMLGTPPYYKNYKAIKADIDEFILWSELTADDGLEAGNIFPRPQKLFIEARFANNKPKIPRQAYGRFSTWDIDEAPNLKFYKNNSQDSAFEQNRGKIKRGLIERFLDKLFGYEPRKKELVLKEENKSLNNSTGYPSVTNLNTAKTGLKLPGEPGDLVASLKWFISNKKKFENMKDCREALQAEKILSKARANRVLTRIVYGLNSEGDFESITEQDLGSDLKHILDDILNNLISDGIKMEYVEDKDAFILELKNYFQAAKDCIE